MGFMEKLFLEKNRQTTGKDSHVDKLTGLHNRNYFQDTYGELGPVKSPDQTTMAVFDIDHFKAHNALIDGNKAICDLVGILKDLLGDRGEALRWGGDEFLVVLRIAPEESLELMRSFVEQVKEKTPVTVSVGMVKIRHEDTFKTNYYRAVQKCYLVKEMGGNDVKL